jgi:hypothetical protein
MRSNRGSRGDGLDATEHSPADSEAVVRDRHQPAPGASAETRTISTSLLAALN